SLGRTQIPQDRTTAAAPAGSREPSTGGESGTGFDQALDTALEIGSEAASAAAALAQAAPQPPMPATDAPMGSVDPTGEQPIVPESGIDPAVTAEGGKLQGSRPAEGGAAESGTLA